jgi:hypothetical protein
MLGPLAGANICRRWLARRRASRGPPARLNSAGELGCGSASRSASRHAPTTGHSPPYGTVGAIRHSLTRSLPPTVHQQGKSNQSSVRGGTDSVKTGARSLALSRRCGRAIPMDNRVAYVTRPIVWTLVAVLWTAVESLWIALLRCPSTQQNRRSTCASKQHEPVRTVDNCDRPPFLLLAHHSNPRCRASQRDQADAQVVDNLWMDLGSVPAVGPSADNVRHGR